MQVNVSSCCTSSELATHGQPKLIESSRTFSQAYDRQMCVCVLTGSRDSSL